MKSEKPGVSYRYCGQARNWKGDGSDLAESSAGSVVSGWFGTMCNGDNSMNRERDSRDGLTAKFGVVGFDCESFSCIRCMTVLSSAS